MARLQAHFRCVHMAAHSSILAPIRSAALDSVSTFMHVAIAAITAAANPAMQEAANAATFAACHLTNVFSGSDGPTFTMTITCIPFLCRAIAQCILAGAPAPADDADPGADAHDEASAGVRSDDQRRALDEGQGQARLDADEEDGVRRATPDDMLALLIESAVTTTRAASAAIVLSALHIDASDETEASGPLDARAAAARDVARELLANRVSEGSPAGDARQNAQTAFPDFETLRDYIRLWYEQGRNVQFLTSRVLNCILQAARLGAREDAAEQAAAEQQEVRLAADGEKEVAHLSVRFPELLPCGIHIGNEGRIRVWARRAATFGELASALARPLRSRISRRVPGRSRAMPELAAGDLVFVHGGKQQAASTTVAEVVGAADAAGTELDSGPCVEILVAVINGKLPRADTKPRVPKDEARRRIESGELRLTCPGGEPADEADDPCAICLHDLRGLDGVSLSCGHCFHTDCLNAWAEEGKPTCPTCRRPLLKRRRCE